MNYETTEQYHSALEPGVVLTIHKPSHERRRKFDRATVAYRQEARRLAQSWEAVREELKQRRHAWNCEQRERLNALELVLAENPGDQETRAAIAALNNEQFSVPQDLRDAMTDIGSELDLVEAENMHVVLFDLFIAKIEGLEIAGKPATPKTLLSDGPPLLAIEIVAYLKNQLGMSGAEQKNLPSPSISSGRVDGETHDTTANAANDPEAIESATAGDTSPNS